MMHRQTRALVALGLVAVAVMLPGLALTLIGHPVFAALAGLGALASVLATFAGGLRVGMCVSACLAVASGLALVWADNPWWAALLMVVVAGAAGLTARAGYSAGVMPAAIVVAFVLAQPPVGTAATGGEALEGVVTILVAGVFATIIATLVDPRDTPMPRSSYGWGQTITYAALLGVLAGLASWFVAARELHQAGAWLVMTILLVVQPSLHDGFRKASERAVGTIVGVVIALVIGLVALPATLIYIIAIACVALAVVESARGSSYWEVVAFFTPAIILLVGVHGSITSTAQDRLFATLIGAGAALVVMGAEALVMLAARANRVTTSVTVEAGG